MATGGGLWLVKDAIFSRHLSAILIHCRLRLSRRRKQAPQTRLLGRDLSLSTGYPWGRTINPGLSPNSRAEVKRRRQAREKRAYVEPAERGTLISRGPARADAAFRGRREIDGLDIASTPILTAVIFPRLCSHQTLESQL